MTVRTIRTAENEAAFLVAVVESGGNVTEACRSSGLTRSAIYVWRKDDEAFAAAFDEALEHGTDAMEDEVTRRAFQGVEESVFYQGKKCGAVTRYSDTLAIFMLKARRPDKFKDRVASEFTGTLTIQPVNYGDDPPTA